MSLLPGEALLHDEWLAGAALEITEGDMELDCLPLISVLHLGNQMGLRVGARAVLATSASGRKRTS